MVIKKIALGGLAAGVVMFIWSAIAHMALPLGEIGIKTIKNEDPVIAAMKAGIVEPGLYFFPGSEAMHSGSSLPPEERQAAMDAWAKKYEAGPRGVLVYHPTGATPMSPRQLVAEFFSDLVAGLIFAFALAVAAGRLRGFGARVGFVTLLGALPWVMTDFAYLNWYGFPLDYTCAQLLEQLVGATLAGIVIALLLRRE